MYRLVTIATPAMISNHGNQARGRSLMEPNASPGAANRLTAVARRFELLTIGVLLAAI
jgi:hypothetical protein